MTVVPASTGPVPDSVRRGLYSDRDRISLVRSHCARPHDAYAHDHRGAIHCLPDRDVRSRVMPQAGARLSTGFDAYFLVGICLGAEGAGSVPDTSSVLRVSATTVERSWSCGEPAHHRHVVQRTRWA